ncbi:subtype B tannase [Levilactobacillus fuyuanensis]|uniref:Subtype B tannase n=2 Tax=Levilactobacillus fuyuanensis TaxID=2486022 RepID=A0ABW4H3W6_9LACO
MTTPLKFDETRYQSAQVTIDGQVLRYRAFLGLDYVTMPVDAIQQLNVFVPEPYFTGGRVNGYTRVTAPIFMPNTVGGYLPGPRDFPGNQESFSRGATILQALVRGYVVVSAGLRGRTSKTAQGEYSGKAPAFIVDMKAAIRYVKFNAGWLPGNPDRIITNGTSAGGATAALAGASGNADFFETPLQALGAAPATDDIFAVSAYCPIHNLEHADAAYEWQFNDLAEWHQQRYTVVNNQAHRTSLSGELTATEQQLSNELKSAFIPYLNHLELKDHAGNPLQLQADGAGSFRRFIADYLTASAQRALAAGTDVTIFQGVKVNNGRVASLDWSAYLRGITRMKRVPAFDALDLSSPETSLFGSRLIAARHFTAFAQKHSAVPAQWADASLVAAINPLTYLTTHQSQIAQHWRIRHGAVDRDTAFAIPVILATKLQNLGLDVDFALPWGRPHSGDYDLPELFDWIDNLCRPATE